ncbi:metalloregulator ArsR/SmtB family transcription factor [Frankia sp. Cas4]|uniref:ArsR/SmtB family transcription factor n=1 Tax=Frankia sp. Cas4 TaxID=3073927 RepID=UPI002AD4F5BD|nr:metalloregulator ArsR/SmtB family transcription factor [Frankia sp. Cas4]
MIEERGPVDDVLLALADPVRQHILRVLINEGNGTATKLAAELPVSRQAVAKHLQVLDRAGLVTGNRSGREVQYEVQPRALDEAARWMAGMATEWHYRLQVIKRLAETQEE